MECRENGLAKYYLRIHCAYIMIITCLLLIVTLTSKQSISDNWVYIYLSSEMLRTIYIIITIKNERNFRTSIFGSIVWAFWIFINVLGIAWLSKGYFKNVLFYLVTFIVFSNIAYFTIYTLTTLITCFIPLRNKKHAHSVAKTLEETSPFPIYANYLSKYNTQTCAICIDDFQSDSLVQELSCGHLFHSLCISQWLEKSDLCPMCKRKV